MSRIMDKFLNKVIIVIIVVMFISGFRSLLTVEDFYTALGGLMGTLPFSEQITDTICQLMQYYEKVPLSTTVTFWEDCLKLALMACIQPFVGTILSLIFLKVPEGNWHDREEYMQGSIYKGKEILVNVVTAPFLALIVAWISAAWLDYITQHWGNGISTVLKIASIVILFGASVVYLILAKVSVLKAIFWRLLVTFIGGMVKTYITNVLALALYVSLIGGLQNMVISSIIALVLWIIIAELIINCFKYIIVGR